jgi:hypothetical protein
VLFRVRKLAYIPVAVQAAELAGNWFFLAKKVTPWLGRDNSLPSNLPFSRVQAFTFAPSPR